MALAQPAPVADGRRHPPRLGDLRAERARRERAGSRSRPARRASRCARTRRFANEPLEMLLESYERYGPVFTLRLFHCNVVFMLGPEANHYMLVSHASNFTLARRALPRPDRADGRRPADDRRRLPPPARGGSCCRRSTASTSPRRSTLIVDETDARARRAGSRARSSTSTRGRAGSRCASRCARCSASTPTARAPARSTPRGLFEEALAFYGRDYFLRVAAQAAARRGRACSRPRASSTR